MNKIKTYLTNLPKAIKVIVGINIGVYLVSLISVIFFNFDVSHYLGFHPTHSDRFKIHQLLTSMFVHSQYYPTHIILNLVFLLLYSVSFERMFGFKKYILMYFLCGITCNVFYNKLQNMEFEYTSKKLTSMGIDYKKLNESDSYDYPKETRKIINRYLKSNYSGIGASGAVFGFITTFIVLSINRIKKFWVSILIGVGLYLIYINVTTLFPLNYGLIGSSIGHIGGMVGGLVFLTYIKTKKVG